MNLTKIDAHRADMVVILTHLISKAHANARKAQCTTQETRVMDAAGRLAEWRENMRFSAHFLDRSAA